MGIGWSFDGFPIYGPHGLGGVLMVRCRWPGADATVCLDECLGYEAAIPDLDNFTYRYYMQGFTSSPACSMTVSGAENTTCLGTCCLASIPPSANGPNALGCRRGCLKAEIDAGFFSASSSGLLAGA